MPNPKSLVPLNPYLQTKLLAIGSGPFLLSLVSALFESGWFSFHILITESVPTDRQRLKELIDYARQSDPKAEIKELFLEHNERTGWQQAVSSFHSILYVSQDNHIEELRNLHAVCREDKKLLLPALCIQQAGLAGPIIHPDFEGCWESAWRRIHQTVLGESPSVSSAFSTSAGAMLANVMVLEWLKAVSGVTDAAAEQAFFLLDLETLEGDWHSFLPHPLVTGLTAAPERAAYMNELEILDELDEPYTDEGESYAWFTYFSRLTSSQAGIFHIWEEGDLLQLPLAQCRVQVADPLSEGPAKLLPAVIRSGLTHAEARREAGLAGIEAYVSRIQEFEGAVQPFVGIGTGETISEGVCRGLQLCLNDALTKSSTIRKPLINLVLLDTVEDEHCKFYLQAITTLQGTPTIGLGIDQYGFPVVWIRTNEEHWYGCVGLNTTLALRSVLQLALMLATNKHLQLPLQCHESSVNLANKEPVHLFIPSVPKKSSSLILSEAMQMVKQSSQQLLVFDLTFEPFMKEGLAGVWGVQLKEEVSR
ncbi:putative thiazole-containing bacteriocin maturation protein [Paenibacillus sp. 1_12]|uniref:hypothetical protein n=1 Tax=Paenibacillus sp. 1_12 TaxID=1566278 RepID=UPI0008EF0FC9|nr:hypothetical protein [Paenibacillus sp. 1_12]SFL65990.1 putative thiazole-containing bacteriocin maturation protein [Paenibacillus sp. 1_12]